MRNIFLFFVTVIILTLFWVGQIVFAQTEAVEVIVKRAQLNAELLQIEKEIEGQRVVLQKKQQEAISLQRDVSILNANIKKAQLGIRGRVLVIDNLLGDIQNKSEFIKLLKEKTQREKDSLAQLLRKTDEIDSASLVEIMLGNKNLSDFFIDIDSFESIKQALNVSLQEIQFAKYTTETEKKELTEKKIEESELKKLQELEKKQLEKNEANKQYILKVTKGKEDEYQKIIKGKEKTAAEIRVALFELRGTKAIPFGQALIYAQQVSKQTGVRPAFLLGIIAEESNLGENVGTGNWIDDMHPERDRPIFKVIATTLGFDPDKMPVSKKPWYGWGGAMGPAQFIPSTWVYYGGYEYNKNTETWYYDQSKDTIRKLVGTSGPSSPWEPEDAFMASGILLRDNGAAKGGYDNERLAALRYFAGWKNATKPAYSFYGDDVMALATKYQGLIKILGTEKK